MPNLCFEVECTILGYRTSEIFFPRTHPIQPVRPKMIFGSASEHLATLQHECSCRICVRWRNALLQCTELLNEVLPRTHPIYHVRAKMMFVSVSEHFATLRHENLCQTYVSRLNALFRCTEVPKEVLPRMHQI